MTVKVLSTWKTETPSGVAGGSTADDMHNLGDSAVGVRPMISAIKTSNYTVTDDDDIIYVDASGGAVTITLLPIGTTRIGKRYTIIKVDTSVNAVIVDGDSSDLVGFSTTQILFTKGAFLTIENTTNATYGWLMTASRGVVSGYIFNQTTSASVTNTTTQTTLLTTGQGALTLPANFWRVGKSLRVRAGGHISSVSNPNLTIRVKIGSTTICDTGAVAQVGTPSQVGWFLDAILTCQTVGGSGVIQGSGIFGYTGGIVGLVHTSGAVVSTTASGVLDITAQWGTAASGNSIVCQNALFEILGMAA